jgi:asparagine synthase (glutamine-hydrolysing)
MSGIAAIFNRDGRLADAGMLAAMLDAVSHRGPDAAGAWTDGPVALGQRMIHSSPESIAEHQPWSDESGRYHVVLDGRIDNRADLRFELIAAGLAPRIDTDAELVLRSFQCWGEEFAARLIGDFAIMIWDGSSQRLLAVRDPTGMRPLYYHESPERFVCGSELHQLFQCGIPCAPNEEIIGEYLAVRTSSAGQTLYTSIQQVLPAHLMIIGRERIASQRYYDLDCATAIRYRDDRDYAEHFLYIFREAVRCRLRSPALVGADLSGGIDSSSIVSIARILEQQGEARCSGFESFSQIYPGLPCDESEYIKAVAAKCGVPLNLEPPTPPEQIDLAAQVEQFRDFPNYPNLTSGFGMRRLQCRKGARLALTGVGGDEWFSGSIEDNADVLRALRIPTLIRQIRTDAAQSETRLMNHLSPLHLLITTAVMPLMPRGLRRLVRWRRRTPYPAWVGPDFARRIDLYARLTAEPSFPHVKGVSRRLLYETLHDGELPITHAMVEQALGRMGLEIRQPFYDRRLIEFAFSIPSDQLRRDGFERYVVRNAMRGILPELVRTRITKASFNDPVLQSIRHNAALISFDRLEIAERGWVDAEKLKSGYETLMASYRNGEAGYGFPVWMAIATEIWHRVVLGSGKFERH